MNQQKLSSKGTALRINAASCSDTGRLRERNQDSIALCEPPDQRRAEQLGWLFLLADGSDSRAAGEVASRMAVETIAAVYYDQATSKEVTEDVLASSNDGRPFQASSDETGSPLVRLQQAFSTAHWRIHELATLKEEYAGMATTCIAAVVKDRQVVIAYVGDSRAYLLRCSSQGSPGVTRLTRDHSMAAQLVRAGVLPPEQMHSSPAGDLLLRMLGGSEDSDSLPDFVMYGVQADDHLMLCCDGLWGMLTEEQIAQIVCTTPPQEACAELVRLANEAGGDENISVIVVSFSGETEQ